MQGKKNNPNNSLIKLINKLEKKIDTTKIKLLTQRNYHSNYSKGRLRKREIKAIREKSIDTHFRKRNAT